MSAEQEWGCEKTYEAAGNSHIAPEEALPATGTGCPSQVLPEQGAGDRTQKAGEDPEEARIHHLGDGAGAGVDGGDALWGWGNQAAPEVEGS